jgi:hypothetical protein
MTELKAARTMKELLRAKKNPELDQRVNALIGDAYAALKSKDDNDI